MKSHYGNTGIYSLLSLSFLLGDIYDEEPAQMHTLDIPDKRRHKRPTARHAPRSASAEVLHRMEEDEILEGENLSPTRRRSRRRRGHGKIINQNTFHLPC